MKKKLLYFLLFDLFCGIFLFSEISFGAASLNDNGDILFSVKTDTAESHRYETLFLYSKQKNKIEQLTFFPERLELLGSKTLQLTNRFGIARLDINTGLISKQAETEQFFSVNSLKPVSIKSIQSSPDGKWITLIEQTSLVYGSLILLDTSSGRKYTLAQKAVSGMLSVSWSPDSKAFLYEDEGFIYFARPEWFGANTTPDKRFRRFSEGSIKSIQWISSLEFLFFKNNVLYKINSSELFTKSFYLPLFSLGKLAARFPFEFNPASDFVSISPDGKTCVFIKEKRNVYFFKFEGDDYLQLFEEGLIPYLLLPGNTADISIYWKNNLPVIFSQGVAGGKSSLKAWQISLSKNKFEKILLEENAYLLAGSPNFEIAAIKENDEISFYDTGVWKKINSFYGEKIISALWKNSSTVFFTGENSLYEYTIDKIKGFVGKKKIALTSMQDFGWSEAGDKILVKVKRAVNEADFNKNGFNDETAEYTGSFNWKTDVQVKIAKKKTANSSDRIYIDVSSGYFKNMIYIRSLDKFTTAPLFEEPSVFASSRKTLSVSEYGNTSSIFSHGNRTGKKQVALVFDAMDGMEGIAEVLYILKKNNIKATFFINGEALRQNPEAVKEVVKAGHQCGSLFFTTWNLNDTEYSIDENFIKQGLARNEDNFYRITGKELSLIWHSPHYIASPMIINAGKKAGYIFISPDIRIPDWISSADKTSLPSLYKSSAEIIEDVCKSVHTGSIIPIRLGKTKPERVDYLYGNLQLLIDSLSGIGFTFSDVKTLMEN